MKNYPLVIKNLCKLILCLLLFVVTSTSVFAAQFLPTGFVLGDCVNSATVTIRVYDEGFLNNPGNLVDTTTTTTAANGAYGTITGSLADSTSFDVNISVNNTACSPGAIGSESLLSQTTGGPIDPPVQLDVNLTMNAPFANSNPSNGELVANNETEFDWISDYNSSLTYRLQIATSPTFTTLLHNITVLTDYGYNLTNAQELADGTYYWRVRAINGGSIYDTTTSTSFDVAAGAATLSGFSPTNNTLVGNTTQSMSFSTNLAANCRYATSPATPFTSKTVFPTTGSTSHSGSLPLSSEGSNNFYVQCNTTSGVLGNDLTYTLRRDTTPPDASSASVIIDSGAALSADTTLDFTWSGFTDTNTVAAYYYSFTNNQGTSSGTVTTNTFGQLTGASQGTVTVYVWAEDSTGNIGNATSDTINVDSLPPAFSTWSTNPNDLSKFSSGSFRVDLNIDETTSFGANPQYRYRLTNGSTNRSWSNWSDMTLSASFGTTYNYFFSIAEGSSPDTWFELAGETLYYQVYAIDAQNLSNNVTRSDFINNQTTPPTLDAISNKNAFEDVLLSFNITGSDPDLSTLTYTCNLSAASVSKINDSLATFRWTPTNTDVGTHNVECNVTDGTFTDSEQFTITVQNSNDAPILSSIGDLYAQEYVFFNYTLNATDVDLDLLLYSSNSTIFTVSAISGTFGFTPFLAHRGVYLINFSVTDGEGGIDYEEVTFTVGYCGDDVCRTGFESCSSCSLDCGECDADVATKAILLDPRNCLDDEMSLRAVTLVTRATCDVKGFIVDGKEVCGSESNTDLKVYYQVDDSWEEVATLVTDEFGYATYTPEEEGVYEMAFASDRDLNNTFEVSSCLKEKQENQIGSSNKKSDSGAASGSKKPAILEEPAVEVTVDKTSFLSILLYFIIVPILCLALIISSMGFAYRLESKKKKSSYVAFIDKILLKLLTWKKKTLAWMHKNPFFKEVFAYWGIVAAFVKKYWAMIKKISVKYYNDVIIALGLQRKINIPMYNLSVKGKNLHLMLLSLIKYCQPERSVNDLLNAIHQYTINALLDLSALLMSFGIKVKIIDAAALPADYLRALLLKGLDYKRAIATRVDLETSLHIGNPFICVLNELGTGNSIIQDIVVVYAYDKKNFYYHSYQQKRFKLSMPKDQFLKSWKSAGAKVLFVKKK